MLRQAFFSAELRVVPTTRCLLHVVLSCWACSTLSTEHELSTVSDLSHPSYPSVQHGSMSLSLTFDLPMDEGKESLSIDIGDLELILLIFFP